MSDTTNTPLERGYRVIVDDNFHFMDQDERWKLGEFATYDEALVAAKKVVEDSFDMNSFGHSAENLYASYRCYGDDPWIAPFGDAPAPATRFSAWDYAKEVSQTLSLAKPPHAPDVPRADAS